MSFTPHKHHRGAAPQHSGAQQSFSSAAGAASNGSTSSDDALSAAGLERLRAGQRPPFDALRPALSPLLAKLGLEAHGAGRVALTAARHDARQLLAAVAVEQRPDGAQRQVAVRLVSAAAGQAAAAGRGGLAARSGGLAARSGAAGSGAGGMPSHDSSGASDSRLALRAAQRLCAMALLPGGGLVLALREGAAEGGQAGGKAPSLHLFRPLGGGAGCSTRPEPPLVLSSAPAGAAVNAICALPCASGGGAAAEVVVVGLDSGELLLLDLADVSVPPRSIDAGAARTAGTGTGAAASGGGGGGYAMLSAASTFLSR